MESSVPDHANQPLAAFVATGGDPSRAELPIRAPVVDIGQGPKNQVVVDDDSVSTRHARLEYDGGVWRLTDLESRNGSYVDGVRLAPGVPTPLREGSTVGFGAARFQFEPREGVRPEDVPPPPTTTSTPDMRSERSGFRLPVWLLLLVLLVVAVIITLIVLSMGNPPTTETAPPALSSIVLLASDPAAA